MVSCCSEWDAATASCRHHSDPWDCSDVLILETDNGPALPIRDGGRSFMLIGFCPFCGASRGASAQSLDTLARGVRVPESEQRDGFGGIA